MFLKIKHRIYILDGKKFKKELLSYILKLRNFEV